MLERHNLWETLSAALIPRTQPPWVGNSNHAEQVSRPSQLLSKRQFKTSQQAPLLTEAFLPASKGIKQVITSYGFGRISNEAVIASFLGAEY
jgi:hypothetical protein